MLSYLSSFPFRIHNIGNHGSSRGVGEALILKLIGGKLVGGLASHLAAAGPAAILYATMGSKDMDGCAKTDIAQIEPCGVSDCDCGDYDDDKLRYRRCHCGHSAAQHESIRPQLEKGQFELVENLLLFVAEQRYPLLKNSNAEDELKRELKRELSEIDTCVNAACPCYDFDFDKGRDFHFRRCRCGHRWREHQVTGNWDWIV
jgi:hypothetical protein